MLHLLAVDSGATETAVGEGILPSVETKLWIGSKRGVEYESTHGVEIPNLGELVLPFRTMEGYICGIKFQLADVKRPLLSVTALTGKGKRVMFTDTGGTIVSQDGKQKIGFRRQQGVYILEVYVPPFQRQGA